MYDITIMSYMIYTEVLYGEIDTTCISAVYHDCT